jgi:hypothetical protein
MRGPLMFTTRFQQLSKSAAIARLDLEAHP